MVMYETVQPEISLKHARRVHEMAQKYFGKNDTNVWLDTIKFEMKHGDSLKVGELYARAVVMLNPNLIHSFITDYSLIMAQHKSM